VETPAGFAASASTRCRRASAAGIDASAACSAPRVANGRRKRDILRAKPAAAAEQHRLLEDGLQLAHVPGREVAREAAEGVVG
jgi:hypothetical protein